MNACAELKKTPCRQPADTEPRILVFTCRWCGGIGADGAGRLRLALPVGFRLIEVECVSRIDPDTILKAFEMGIDGVAVIGCHLDGCRYNRANHATAKRMTLLSTLLETVGVGADRLVTSFGTAHEGHPFADLIRRFDRRLRTMPPICTRSAGTEPVPGGAT